MRVLITGNKGFIATHLQNAIAERYPKWSVYGFEINDNPMDWCDMHYDIIFHLAAVARIVNCTQDPFGQAHKSNVELTRILLEKFSFDKFIYTSSCVVYGDRSTMTPFSETDSLEPNSLYAAQKYYSENMVNLHLQHMKKSSVCLRLFNVYGEGQSQFGDYPNVLAALIKCYKENDYVEVTGNGIQSRDFVYVSDVVEALLLSTNISYDNHIFNVACNDPKSVNNLAHNITYNIKYIEDRPFDIFKLSGNYEKIKNSLGWEPKVGFDEGLKRVLEYESVL